MKKFFAFLLILFSCPLMAGVYGILHDQLTYTLCPEYFTKFKFIQFHIREFIDMQERKGVIIVGFLATWWVGLFVGLVLAPLSLIFKKAGIMIRVAMRALLLNLVIAFIVGLTGFFYGKYVLVNDNLNWWFPENLIDKNSFIAVGSMHNFSYAGGAAGLVIAIFYVIREKVKKG